MKHAEEPGRWTARPLRRGRPEGRGAHVDALVVCLSGERATDVESLARVLSAAERMRFDRIRGTAARARRIVGRAAARIVLADSVGASTTSMQIVTSDRGKPFVPGWGGTFSVSHSGDLVAVAITTAGDIGIDVEKLRDRNVIQIAHRLFTAREARFVAGANDAVRLQRFYALWTSKEAWLKARGVGLAVPLDTFEIDSSGVVSAEERAEGHAGSLMRLSVPADNVGALALVGARIESLSTSWLTVKELADAQGNDGKRAST